MGQVRLILREDVRGLGAAGDVVTVKPGYARNFLIPGGKAIPATEGRMRELEHHQRVVAERLARELRAHETMRDRLQALELEALAQAGEEGKLFGSVTAAQIAELLAEKGLEIDRRKIELPEPIKELGEHTVPVRLHREVIAEVRLKVVPTE